MAASKPGKGIIAAGILFFTVPPLCPLFAEWFIKGGIDAKSLTLASSIYCFAIMSASQRALVFVVGLILGFVEALMYGFASQVNHPPAYLWLASVGSIVLLGVLHGYERKERHGQEKEPIIKLKNW